jgi:hypothetical protein
VFGYYFSNKECFFLTAHRGEIFIWSAVNLFQSNNQLPLQNPTRKPYFFSHKDIQGGGLVKNEEKYSTLRNKRYSLNETLDKFRFGLCFIPNSTLVQSLKIDLAEKSKVKKQKL